MVEWFKAPVLKTGVSFCGTMGSNPILSVLSPSLILKCNIHVIVAFSHSVKDKITLPAEILVVKLRFVIAGVGTNKLFVP